MKRKVDRLLEYLELKGITENRATAECRLSQGLIYQAKSGKADLGARAMEKILATYTDLNRVWLLTGEGSMLTSEQPENPMEEQPEERSIVDKLFAILAEEQKSNKILLELLREKDEKIEALQEEIRHYREHKGETAKDAATSFAANAV